MFLSDIPPQIQSGVVVKYLPFLVLRQDFIFLLLSTYVGTFVFPAGVTLGIGMFVRWKSLAMSERGVGMLLIIIGSLFWLSPFALLSLFISFSSLSLKNI
jgi:hypothetical protein